MPDGKLDPASQGHVELWQEEAQDPGPADAEHGGPSNKGTSAGPHPVPASNPSNKKKTNRLQQSSFSAEHGVPGTFTAAIAKLVH